MGSLLRKGFQELFRPLSKTSVWAVHGRIKCGFFSSPSVGEQRNINIVSRPGGFPLLIPLPLFASFSARAHVHLSRGEGPKTFLICPAESSLSWSPSIHLPELWAFAALDLSLRSPYLLRSHPPSTATTLLYSGSSSSFLRNAVSVLQPPSH